MALWGDKSPAGMMVDDGLNDGAHIIHMNDARGLDSGAT
jgi:hypothetical protein